MLKMPPSKTKQNKQKQAKALLRMMGKGFIFSFSAKHHFGFLSAPSPQTLHGQPGHDTLTLSKDLIIWPNSLGLPPLSSSSCLCFQFVLVCISLAQCYPKGFLEVLKIGSTNSKRFLFYFASYNISLQHLSCNDAPPDFALEFSLIVTLYIKTPKRAILWQIAPFFV